MADYVTRQYLTGADIRDLRTRLGFTQKDLSVFLRCSKRRIESWENSTGKITGPIVPLIEILIRHPDLAGKLELSSPEGCTLRVWYYHRQLVCSVINVSEPMRTVSVKNYVDDPLYRAFGINTEPSYEDYETFLESRCFPSTRDKMKLQLKELNIPFYDPLLIIDKTEGRMAGDDFWIRMERL